MPRSCLHVVASTDRRGAEVFGYELHHDLLLAGWPSTIVAARRPSGPPALDIPVLGPGPFAPTSLRSLRARARGAEVAVAHGSVTLPMVALACTGTSTPFVYKSIGMPGDWDVGWSRRVRTGWLLRRAGAVVALWRGAADALVARHSLRPDRVHVIHGAASDRFRPPAADERAAARRELGLADGERVVALVGALSEEKQPLLAIDAAAQAGATLLIAGDGPMAGVVADRASSSVRVLGLRGDVRPVYWAADALVVSSRSEGMCGAILEAGACGVAAASTVVGAAAELVDDGRTGRLCRSPDVDGLAEAIDDVLSSSLAMGEEAHRHVTTRYSWRSAADRWCEVLRSVAEEREGR